MNRDEALTLLKKHASDDAAYAGVVRHVKAVCTLALEIADKAIAQGHSVDRDFVETAALLHDIGRFTHPPKTELSIQHGVAGANILRAEGHEQHARVAERHSGPGITVDDIKQQKLPLPEKDMCPETIEEKIICYADNLIFGFERGTIERVIDRFRTEINEAVAQRTIQLHNEIMELIGEEEKKL